MAKYAVEFTLHISATRTIEADSLDDARREAYDMIYDEPGYWDDVVDDMENDFEQWRKKYCSIEAFEESDAY